MSNYDFINACINDKALNIEPRYEVILKKSMEQYNPERTKIHDGDKVRCKYEIAIWEGENIFLLEKYSFITFNTPSALKAHLGYLEDKVVQKLILIALYKKHK